MWAEA
ncbi:hypothetical protein YPPY55_1541, partial [Yersinia pestis PY-55]